jgi:transcription elongation factor GreA
MNHKVKMTQEGYDKLGQEYDELVNNKRVQAVARLKRAREMGDLSENSEYVAAKEDLALVEGRIQEVESLLNQAEIVASINGNSHVINIGSKVTLLVDGTTENYLVVGEMEADPTQNKLSCVSPMGKAIMGKHKGDTVKVNAPAGTRSIQILDIT